MFSFCIYDKKNQELFLARDRFGIKPCYYIIEKNKFIFSSEIKALFSFIDKKNIDKEALSQFFNFRFTLGNKTLVKGIKKLLPGHFLRYDLKNNTYKIKQYYSLKKQSKSKLSFKDLKKLTRKKLKKV